MNNLRQLQLAVTYFCDVNDDTLPSHSRWVQNQWMDFNGSNPANTDLGIPMNFENALLALYTETPAIYKCPADRSTVKIKGKPVSRIRSMSMNAVGSRGRTTFIPRTNTDGGSVSRRIACTKKWATSPPPRPVNFGCCSTNTRTRSTMATWR